MAPLTCALADTLMDLPDFFSRARTTPMFLATPPVIISGSVMPTRLAMAITREPMDSWMPAMMFCLAVLAADVDDAAHGRVLKMGASCVAGDFGHGLVGKVDAVATVAGSHDPIHRIFADAKLRQQVGKHILPGIPGVVPGQDNP